MIKKTTNTFRKGVMLKDVDMSLLPNDYYRHAENLRFNTNGGGDGVGKNIKGTVEVSNETNGNTDYKCVRAYFDKNTDNIWYLLASSDGLSSKMIEYNVTTGKTEVVLNDTRGVLNFNKEGYITGFNEINGLAIFSEWGNDVRKVNIERLKKQTKDNGGYDGFEADDIKLIVKPPLQKARIKLIRDSDGLIENNIKEKMLAFSYQYRYIDGEYSKLAPFTNFAFKPFDFNYNYKTQSNESMVNYINKVDIIFNTGSKNVTDVRLVFKESSSKEAFIIDEFNKSLLNWGDDESRNFVFDNKKTIRPLPQMYLDNIYDNVPLTAKAQTLIKGRLILANYLENLDIKDCQGNDIELKYRVELKTSKLDKGSVSETVKTLRDYELFMVYRDADFRMTTALSSKTNNVYVPVSCSDKKNELVVKIEHKAPCKAKYYQFFIRQNKTDYDTILPIEFYKESSFRYIKIEKSDIDKVKKGDFWYIKADTSGLLRVPVKVKILEAEVKEKGFIKNAPYGFYVKIEEKGFILNGANSTKKTYSFNSSTHGNSGGFHSLMTDYIRNNVSYATPSSFYGLGNNPLTVLSGSDFNGNKDTVFKIQVTSAETPTEKARIAIFKDDIRILENIEIEVNRPISLGDGVEIAYTSETGFNLNDYWVIRGKSPKSLDLNLKERPVGVIPLSLSNDSQRLPAGTKIELKYKEYGYSSNNIDPSEQPFIVSKDYDNAEEWFYGDGIDKYFPKDRVFFRTGELIYRNQNVDKSVDKIKINKESSGLMFMLIKAKKSRHSTLFNSGFREDININTKVSLTVFENPLIFEKDPEENNNDIFYEIGTVYEIDDSRNHLGSNSSSFDKSQYGNYSVATILLDWFNAFSFGNGVESYKVKDFLNNKGLDTGVRVTSKTIDRYEQVHRKENATWSDLYNKDNNFNGLASFDLSTINWVVLDSENGSIQKLHNTNDSIMVLQEEGAGYLLYNKNIIYGADTGKQITLANNILNEKSYRPYQFGKVGIGANPESFVADGSRVYFSDKPRGNWVRLSINGVTEINEYNMEVFTTDLMRKNKSNFLVGGYDPTHKEILLHFPSEKGCYVFKEKEKGFTQKLTFEPDFILNADNDCYAWKNGVMFKLNASEERNIFFNKHYPSKLKFSVNEGSLIQKVFRNIGIHSSHRWSASLKTKLTSRKIKDKSFVKKEGVFFSEIMGNTEVGKESSVFGLGEYEINNGVVEALFIPETLVVGDILKSLDNSVISEILEINNNTITLKDRSINSSKTYLKYFKDQNIDGGDIRGEYLVVTLQNNNKEPVEIRAVTTQITKSFNT